MRFALPFRWPQRRERKPSVLLFVLFGCVLFTILFIFGFFISFPDSVLHDRIVAEVNRLLPVGNSFEAKAISLGFPLRLQLDDAQLVLDSSAPSELTLSSVSLSPALSTLIGHPGVNVEAQSELGTLNGTLSSSGLVDLHLNDGIFELPFPDLPGLKIAGNLTFVDLAGQLQIDKNEPIRLQVNLDDLVLTGVDQFGLSQNSLPLGQVVLGLSGSGRSLKIEQFYLTGGAVTVSGSGKVVVQQPFDASRLDLKLSLRPEAAAGSGLRTLLELLGPVGKDGSHSVHLRGRLLAPQLK